MPRKIAKSGNDAINAMSAIFTDEQQAREFMEAKRWPNGAVCPHCGSTGAYKLSRPGVHKCKGCRKQFTVRVGTIFEDSKLPIRHWLYAMHLMSSSKKGVSSHQIARELDITVKSAWFMTHRIREAMTQEPMPGMLKGHVESDETYIGGKQRNAFGKRGRMPAGFDNKKPVHALIERDGDAVVRPMPRIKADQLRKAIDSVVDKENTMLHTDELAAYKTIGRTFGKGHDIVNHKQHEYARGEAGINTAESFFAILKRGHYGTFHLLSENHLHRYCNEFSFRWKYRKVSDGERLVQAIKRVGGKRLTYRGPVNPVMPEAEPDHPF
jgi:transposase-like protein